MKHPEGRLVAVHQQMHFAGLVSQQIHLDPEKILAVISEAGLMLVPDVNEIALDAAAIMPRLHQHRLHAVKDAE